MADLDERLNQLISDQESMQKVLEMAKAILAQRDSANPAPAEEAPPVPTPAPAPQPTSAVPEQDLSAMLGALMARQAEASAPSPNAAPAETTSSSEGSQSLAPLAAVLPQLMQALSGDGNLIKSERVDLLRAMRPYLKESRSGSIDRALKMANVTKAATSAMHLLGR